MQNVEQPDQAHAMNDLHQSYGHLSDESWRDLLIESSRRDAPDIKLPAFPSPQIQA